MQTPYRQDSARRSGLLTSKCDGHHAEVTGNEIGRIRGERTWANGDGALYLPFMLRSPPRYCSCCVPSRFVYAPAGLGGPGILMSGHLAGGVCVYHCMSSGTVESQMAGARGVERFI